MLKVKKHDRKVFSCKNCSRMYTLLSILLVLFVLVVNRRLFVEEPVQEMVTNTWDYIAIDSNTKQTGRFLHSYASNVIDVKPPDFLPHLRSSCFYDKILKSDANNTPLSRPEVSLRCLPKIFLVGFPKCGTSDLHSHIAKHQYIYPSLYKETHFWAREDRTRNRCTMKYYTEFFAITSSLIDNCCLAPQNLRSRERCKASHLTSQELKFKCLTSTEKRNRFDKFEEAVVTSLQEKLNKTLFSGRLTEENLFKANTCPIATVDSSPDYIWKTNSLISEPANQKRGAPKITAAERIKHIVPQAKIIIIMRRPEERLWSDYNFFYGGRKSADHFHKCVVQGIHFWQRCLAVYPMETCAFGLSYRSVGNIRDLGRIWERNSADRLRISIYYIYVKRWLDVFQKDNVLCIRFEDYIKDPFLYVTSYVFPFLDLDSIYPYGAKTMQDAIEKGPRNSQGNKSVTMHEKTRALLQQFYEPYNVMLATLLQDDRYLWDNMS